MTERHDWSLAHVGAHKHSSGHRAELERSNVCGCFFCLDVFPPTQIGVWIGEGDTATARCPHCGIDSVIGAAAGYPIEKAFLRQMKSYWFAGS